MSEAPHAAHDMVDDRLVGMYERTAPGVNMYDVVERLKRARELQFMTDLETGLVLAQTDAESRAVLAGLHGMDMRHNHGVGAIRNQSTDLQTSSGTLLYLTRALPREIGRSSDYEQLWAYIRGDLSRDAAWSGPNPNAAAEPAFDYDRKGLCDGFETIVDPELRKLMPQGELSQEALAAALKKFQISLVRVILHDDLGIEKASEADAQAVIDAVAVVTDQMPTIYYPKSYESQQMRERYRQGRARGRLGRILGIR